MSQSIHYSPSSLNHAYAAPEIVHQRQRTLDSINLSLGQSVLDVGCGTGFLTASMAELVGKSGAVCAIDKENDMVSATKDRCKSLTQVSSSTGDVTQLSFPDNHFDVVTCTQVLLYVEEVEKAINEMQRVLKPGGKLAILETDWRTTVMYSRYPETTETIYRAWDNTVPSPNLPVRLNKLMTDAGITDINIEAIPLVNTSFDPMNFSVSSLNWLSGNAYKKGAITKEESQKWREDLASLGDTGEYFFCVNRFLFVGVGE
ncbi:MAG: methyltransferase domain-containing protein [Acidiferrobacterales bacterium]|nr:methyltransferase domain-containing protein [Acidiferrobacterales bacterium]